MPADFQIIAGTSHVLVPLIFDNDGNAIPAPAGATFQWQSSDPNISFDDATLQSPAITGAVPTDPNGIGIVITGAMLENGFPHQMTHTFDVLPAQVTDPVGKFDFTVNP